MEREAKLRKLNRFRRALPHVTASALSAILIAVRQYGAPDMHNRVSLREARELQTQAETPFGPIVQTVEVVSKNDETVHLQAANPFAMLWTAVSECKPFMDLLKTRLLQKPSTIDEPWQIALYSDEVTPGNPLATGNHRKFHAMYWTFLELGSNALSREESWLTCMTEMSTWINDIHAGLSQAFAAILKLFFDPAGVNMAVTGINLPFDTRGGQN